MLESIVLIIFVLSFGGMLFILARKIPVLILMPKNGTSGISKSRFILDIESKIKRFFIYFEKQIFLHKLLLRLKVLILKIEAGVDILLHKIRKRAQEANRNLKHKK